MSVPNITSQEQYDALLPGTQYRRPDGQIRTKSGSAPMQAKPLDGFLSGQKADSGGMRNRIVSGMRDFADQNLFPDGIAEMALDAATRGVASVIESPTQAAKTAGKFLFVDPAVSMATAPANTAMTLGTFGEAGGSLLRGDVEGAKESGARSLGYATDALVGATELATLGRGGAFVRGVKPDARQYTSNVLSQNTNRLKTKPTISDEIAEQVGTDAKVTPVIDDAVDAAEKLMPPSLIPQGKEQNIYDYMRSVSGIKDPKEFRSSLLRAADDETIRPDMLLQDPNLPGYRIAGVGLGRRAGPSQNIMQKAARAQQSEQSQRVNEAFNVALGRPKDMIDTLDDINIRIDKESKPLYDKAFAKGIQPTEELQEVLNIPLVKDYKDKAVKDLAYMGQATENQLEILDQVKKSLDDEIGRNIQQNTKKRARDLIIIKNKLLKEIDKANPEYAQARSVFAGEEANKNAMDYGLKNITNKKTRPKQFARDIEKYSKSEKEALLSGIKDQIDILLDNPESYSALKGQFRTPSFKAKLETVIGKEKTETLVNDLVRQAELADAAKATDVGANSITASGTEAIKLAEQPAKSGAMQAIAKGTEAVGDVKNLANLIPFLGRKVGDKTLRTLGKAGDVVDEDITTAAAQLLTMPTRDAAQMLLDLDIDVRKRISGRLLDDLQGVKILSALPKQSALSALAGTKQSNLTALGGLAGGSAVRATTPNVVNITTQQQYDSLPAGTRYRRSDGQIRTKR